MKDLYSDWKEKSSSEKHDLIVFLCKKHEITAYEINKNTNISTIGISNILSKKSENPRQNNLNLILEYLYLKLNNSDTKNITISNNEILQEVLNLKEYFTETIDQKFEKIIDNNNKKLKELKIELLKENFILFDKYEKQKSTVKKISKNLDKIRKLRGTSNDA